MLRGLWSLSVHCAKSGLRAPVFFCDAIQKYLHWLHFSVLGAPSRSLIPRRRIQWCPTADRRFQPPRGATTSKYND